MARKKPGGEPRPVRTTPFFIRMLGSILPLLILVGGGEIALRLARAESYYTNQFFPINRDINFMDVYERDPALFWKFRPNRTIDSDRFSAISYHINSLGFRGPEPDTRPVDLRILALGNSCTFGWGVSWEDTWTSRLELMVEQGTDGKNVEVSNAGVPGYSSHQGKILFERQAAKLAPNIVLITFGWNDHWVAGKGISDAEHRPGAGWLLGVHNAVSQSRLFQAARKGVLSLTEKETQVRLDQVGLCRVPIDQFYNNLTEIVRTARARKIEPYLVIPPVASLDNYFNGARISTMHQVHASYQKEVHRAGLVNQVPVIDLQAAFDSHRDLFDDAHGDPVHYNARGHQVAAEAIWQTLKPRLIPPPPDTIAPPPEVIASRR